MDKKLFSCMYGSRLYGTHTPTSDTDWKHIVLPDLDDLLLGKKVQNSVKKTNNKENTRNTAEDVDEEFIPIQVFARDFLMGQTYAIELAFAVDGTHAGQEFHQTSFGEQLQFLAFVWELRERFLTSNVKAMMGYAVNQANLYSFKGERLNAARDVEKILKEYALVNEEGILREIADDFRWTSLETKYPKYFKQTTYDIGAGRSAPCFVLLEKTLPFTNAIAHSLTVVSSLIKKYGARADSATADNVDWKAMMHALRIVDEGIELLSTHKITLPLPQEQVDKLLKIKRGEYPLENLKQELSTKLDQLKELEQTTSLPPVNDKVSEFEQWLKIWLREMYKV